MKGVVDPSCACGRLRSDSGSARRFCVPGKRSRFERDDEFPAPREGEGERGGREGRERVGALQGLATWRHSQGRRRPPERPAHHLSEEVRHGLPARSIARPGREAQVFRSPGKPTGRRLSISAENSPAKIPLPAPPPPAKIPWPKIPRPKIPWRKSLGENPGSALGANRQDERGKFRRDPAAHAWRPLRRFILRYIYQPSSREKIIHMMRLSPSWVLRKECGAELSNWKASPSARL